MNGAQTNAGWIKAGTLRPGPELENRTFVIVVDSKPMLAKHIDGRFEVADRTLAFTAEWWLPLPAVPPLEAPKA